MSGQSRIMHMEDQPGIRMRGSRNDVIKFDTLFGT
jgi:hypothetical protein